LFHSSFTLERQDFDSDNDNLPSATAVIPCLWILHCERFIAFSFPALSTSTHNNIITILLE